MIKATYLATEGNPSLTGITDDKGTAIQIASSSSGADCFSPRELVQAGLAGCLSMTIRRVLRDNGIAFRDLTVTVDMSQREGKTCFTYQVSVDSDADPELVDRIQRQAASGCYIRGLLTDGILVEEAAAEEAAVSDRCCD